MKHTSAVALGLALAFFGLTGVEHPRTAIAQSAAPWTTLLDGTNMNQWMPIGEANWRVAGGAVQADNGMPGFLVSKESYGDFDLRVEFWVSPDANSGVFIRCADPKQVTAANSYEVNIFDTRPDPAYRTGGIVDVAKPASMVNAGNQWNTIEISARGRQLTVRLNGMPMVDVQDDKHARGPIALQASAGTVKFRSVQIR
jgi:hypothetical protein